MVALFTAAPFKRDSCSWDVFGLLQNNSEIKIKESLIFFVFSQVFIINIKVYQNNEIYRVQHTL